MTPSGTVVIGVGNDFRRDDGAGPAVIEALRRLRLPELRLATCDGEPTTVIDLWTGAGLAIVVDTVRVAGGEPGRIHRLGVRRPSAGGGTTHHTDVLDTIALARALDRLPDTLLLYAIQVADTGFGIGLTPAVRSAVRALTDEIAGLVRRAPVADEGGTR